MAKFYQFLSVIVLVALAGAMPQDYERAKRSPSPYRRYQPYSVVFLTSPSYYDGGYGHGHGQGRGYGYGHGHGGHHHGGYNRGYDYGSYGGGAGSQAYANSGAGSGYGGYGGQPSAYAYANSQSYAYGK